MRSPETPRGTDRRTGRTLHATAWLDPVRAGLDALGRPAEVFFHDRRAGVRDDRLERLLGVFSAHGLRCDVAVDPDALTPATVGMLTGWGLVDGMRFHQHGGTDVGRGRTRLTGELGELLDAVLDPGDGPFTHSLSTDLVSLGMVAVVQDTGAPPLGAPGLAAVPVHVAWPGRGRGLGRTREATGVRVAEALTTPGPVGVGLNHATMGPEEMADLDQLLDLLASHPCARPTTIGRLVGAGTAACEPRTRSRADDHLEQVRSRRRPPRGAEVRPAAFAHRPPEGSVRWDVRASSTPDRVSGV